MPIVNGHHIPLMENGNALGVYIVVDGGGWGMGTEESVRNIHTTIAIAMQNGSSVGESELVDPLLEHTQEGSENNESAPGLKEWYGNKVKWNFLGVERPFVKRIFGVTVTFVQIGIVCDKSYAKKATPPNPNKLFLSYASRSFYSPLYLYLCLSPGYRKTKKLIQFQMAFVF